MRLGCLGCLVLIVAILIVGVAAAGFVFLSGNMGTPPDVQPTRFTRADGYSAQRKLYELVLRESGRSTRTDPGSEPRTSSSSNHEPTAPPFPDESHDVSGSESTAANG